MNAQFPEFLVPPEDDITDSGIGDDTISYGET